MADKISISAEDGKILVKTARKIVTEYLSSGKKIELGEKFLKSFSFNSGIFISLKNQSGLRGCIGHPLSDKKLFEALEDAAIAAATQDPRFSPVKFNELNSIKFEVTILTPPTKIEVKEPKEYLSYIKIGRDGLIVKSGYSSGLLLPQVPIEYGWNEQEFLEYTCEKAGLPKEIWETNEIEIYKFEGIVFKEKEPNGEIIQEKLLD